MRHLVLLVLLPAAACSSRPAQVATTQLQTHEASCSAMLGDGWIRANPPGISRELLAMAGVAQPPEDIVWYAKEPASYAACVQLASRHECGYAAHTFTQLPEHGGKNWAYLSGSVKRQWCM